MSEPRPRLGLFLLALVILVGTIGFLLGIIADDKPKQTLTAGPMNPLPEGEVTEEGIEVPRPPFSKDIFPCSDCHSDMDVNPERRELVEEHTNIVLHHDEKNRWCLDCHNANDRDKLHLASGALVEFSESYKLCGQCHGEKMRDWRAGVHGKRTGHWRGEKRYLLCVHCHNPHSPRFEPIEPEPSPKQPEELFE